MSKHLEHRYVAIRNGADAASMDLLLQQLDDGWEIISSVGTNMSVHYVLGKWIKSSDK